MMLSKRQREFRKMMKEVEKRQVNRNVYSYREKRYPNEKPKRQIKKPILQIGGVFGLILLIWNLYALSTYINTDANTFGIVSTKTLKVHNYLEKGGEAEIEISQTVNSLIDQYNDNSLTILHIEEAQRTLFDLQKSISLDNDRFAVMNRYFEEQFNLAYQLTNILQLQNAPTVNQELLYIIDKQKELSASRTSILIHLLDNEKMKYQILGDGTISYEY